jgi:hypothetical protein
VSQESVSPIDQPLNEKHHDSDPILDSSSSKNSPSCEEIRDILPFSFSYSTEEANHDFWSELHDNVGSSKRQRAFFRATAEITLATFLRAASPAN